MTHICSWTFKGDDKSFYFVPASGNMPDMVLTYINGIAPNPDDVAMLEEKPFFNDNYQARWLFDALVNKDYDGLNPVMQKTFDFLNATLGA